MELAIFITETEVHLLNFNWEFLSTRFYGVFLFFKLPFYYTALQAMHSFL